MSWVRVSLILCVFGFLRELEPSESFVSDYLTGSWKNFTSAEVNQDIFPVGTYTYLVVSILVFLITDLLRYKPVIIISGLAETVTYALMIFATTVVQMQISQFFFGIFNATEVAYFTYMYAKVDKKHYQEVTSYTRTAYLLGKFVAGVVAQIATSFELLDYYQLNFISLTGAAVATVWALFLPSVKQTIYFHRAEDELNNIDIHLSKKDVSLPKSLSTVKRPKIPKNSVALSFKVKRALPLLWEHFLAAYTNMQLIKWSFWWAVATCIYLQVFNYIQLLWQTVEDSNDVLNGAVEAIYTAISAAASFGIGKVNLNWDMYGEITLALFSFLGGAMLIVASLTYNVWIAYLMYIVFGACYYTMVTIVSSEVAKLISEDSCGLIFGINTTFSLVLQSVLTLTVVNEVGLTLDIRPQFLVYGGCMITLAVVFIVLAINTLVQRCKNGLFCRATKEKQELSCARTG